jgi:farnesyl diphosphate synthase
MRTCIGQSIDLMTGSLTNRQFECYTQERYNQIVIWKTAYYSFYLPVACALYLANIDDENVHSTVKPILLKIG